MFVPVVNPDGYEVILKKEVMYLFQIDDFFQYTWTTNRLWRKNRHPTPGSACTGVDLNRNYDDHWGEVSFKLCFKSERQVLKASKCT